MITEGKDRREIYVALITDPKTAGTFKKYSFKEFENRLLNDEKAASMVAERMVQKGIAQDVKSFYDNYMTLPATKAQPAPQPSQPPAVSLAPPQRQSIEQQAAGQATGFVPPMAEQPEQPMQPDLGAKSGGLNLGRAFGGVAPVFQDEAQIKQEAQSPVFLANELAAQNVEGAAVSPTQQAVSASQRDFAKMSPEQQAQVIAGSTGSKPNQDPIKQTGKLPVVPVGLIGLGTKAVNYGIDIWNSMKRGWTQGEAINQVKQGDLADAANGNPEALKKIDWNALAKTNREISEFGQTEGDKSMERAFSGDSVGINDFVDFFTALPGVTVESLANLARSGWDEATAGAVEGAALGSAVPGIGTVAGAGVGVTAGMIAAGRSMEYYMSLLEELKNKGVDVNNPEALKKGMAAYGKEASEVATTRANAITAVETLLPVLGKVLRLGGGKIAARAAGKLGKAGKVAEKVGGVLENEAIAGPLGGSAGELAAQVGSGQEINLKEIAAEAGGEGAATAAAVARAIKGRTTAPTPPTQLGGIPTIPAPPNAPEFVPPVPPPSGADQTTYETVSPEELQAFQTDPNFATNNPERAAAIADDVALIQSGQKDINSIDDANYRLMVESVMGAGQQGVDGGGVTNTEEQGVLVTEEIEKTTKALDELELKNPEAFSDLEDMFIDANLTQGEYDNSDLSKAYYQAKADGSNPELVQSVESLLANATPQSETIVADQAAQNMGTAVNQPLETGAAAVEVGESGRPVVEVEGDQVVEEEKPVEEYDFAKAFEPLTKEEQEKADKERLADEANEKQRLFDKAGFDKNWAKDYDEAKTKLIDQYNKAKEKKEKAQAKVIKKSGGKTVFVGDEVGGVNVSIDRINEKNRLQDIAIAEKDMAEAVKDLAKLGVKEADLLPSQKNVKSSEKAVVKPKEQNFTQFAKENGYPDDYDTSFQAQLLGSRGLEGQRQSNRSIKEQDAALQEMQNKKAEGKKAYEQAILDGKVIDPDGKLTREGILKRDYDFNKKELESKIANAESGIKRIEGLGKMAHLDNGRLKKGYQGAVDDYNETIAKHKESLDKLKAEYEQSLKATPQAGSGGVGGEVKTMDDFDTFKEAVAYNVKRTADIGIDESEANYGDAKNINEIKSDLEKAGIQVEKVSQSSMSDGNYASFDGDKIKVTDENIPLQVLLHEIGEKVVLDLDKAKQKIEHSNNIFEAVTTYGASRGNDAFADNFYLYFLSPQTLKDLSPNVYAELDKLIPQNIKDLGKSLMSKYGVKEQTLKYNKPKAVEQSLKETPQAGSVGVGGKKDYEMSSSEYEAERQLSIPIFNKAKNIANKILNWSGTDGLYEKYLNSIGVKDKDGVYEDTSINDIDGYMKFLLKEKADFFTKEDYNTYLKYQDFMDRGINPDWSNHKTRVSIALLEGKKVPNEVLKEYPELSKEQSLKEAPKPKAEKTSPLAPFQTKDKEGQAARAALKESVGQKEFKRLENIAKNGEKILRDLESRGVLKIDCP